MEEKNEGLPSEERMKIDAQKLEDLRIRMEGEQNIGLAMAAGVAAAAVGAGVWAVVTALTHIQIGFMAIGVGFLVGYAVRTFGKGMSGAFGIIGAGFSLLGCLAGNLLAVCAALAEAESIPFSTVLANLNLGLITELMKVTFHPMDLLFYGIAVYEGYRFSFRGITQTELKSMMKES